MNASDGSGKSRVTSGILGSELYPAWSPDGTRIAFSNTSGGTDDIYTINVDGTNMARLTSDPGNENNPAWSPDGTKLAFNNEAPDADIDVMNADGTGRRVLIADADELAWSPAGDKIAFDSHFPSGITVANVDGSGRIVVASDGGRPDWQPVVASTVSTVSQCPALNAPPDCSKVTSTVSALWPPNHKYRLIALSGATDPDGNQVTLTVTGVTQDEPVNGLGDGDTAPDAKKGPGSNQVYVRAERSGLRDGRVYRIAFTGSDGNGGTCSGTALVGAVPHDQGKGSTPVDSAPPSYDSFGP